MSDSPTTTTLAASRPQSLAEEIANAITHGLGLAAAVAALPILLAVGVASGDAYRAVGSAVFGATLVLLYLSSTLYHALRPCPAKERLRVLDHSAIYLLIAGTYTPFMLGALRGPWGWSLLAVIWSLAVAGIVAKLVLRFRFPRLSTWLYLGMGWLIVVAIQPLAANVSSSGVAWLVVGGLCYTGGVIFYVKDARIRFGHALWHLFVLAGSACHYLAVLWHAAPAAA